MAARTFSIVSLLVIVLAPALRGEGPEDRILYPGAARMSFIGPFGGVDNAIHKGRFTTTENGILCCAFDEGRGLGPALGVKAFFPVLGVFDFSPRLLYENPRGEFTAFLQRYPIRGLGNTIELVDLENKLEVDLHVLTVDLFAAYVFPFAGVYLAAGPSFGFLLGNHFFKRETILGPPGVTYLDGTTSQVMYDDSYSLPSTFRAALRGGIGARIGLSHRVYLNPEILYSHPLTRASKEGEWKYSVLQGTLGVLISF
ncbi:MAG: hypothetical protein QHI48_03765 [Bacteroidota bacterium]|nr:hypothetical protein [Bacteroidota bacterium]